MIVVAGTVISIKPEPKPFRVALVSGGALSRPRVHVSASSPKLLRSEELSQNLKIMLTRFRYSGKRTSLLEPREINMRDGKQIVLLRLGSFEPQSLLSHEKEIRFSLCRRNLRQGGFLSSAFYLACCFVSWE